MDTKEIERVYAEMSRGSEKPNYVLCTEGAFLSKGDGTLEVFDFDSDGNHYPLSKEEQELRKDRLRRRLDGIAHS